MATRPLAPVDVTLHYGAYNASDGAAGEGSACKRDRDMGTGGGRPAPMIVLNVAAADSGRVGRPPPPVIDARARY